MARSYKRDSRGRFSSTGGGAGAGRVRIGGKASLKRRSSMGPRGSRTVKGAHKRRLRVASLVTSRKGSGYTTAEGRSEASFLTPTSYPSKRRRGSSTKAKRNYRRGGNAAMITAKTGRGGRRQAEILKTGAVLSRRPKKGVNVNGRAGVQRKTPTWAYARRPLTRTATIRTPAGVSRYRERR